MKLQAVVLSRAYTVTASCRWIRYGLLAWVAAIGLCLLSSMAQAQQVGWSFLQIPPQYGHAMVYDSARGETVLFGGLSSSSFFNGGPWEWNGTTWTRRAVSGPDPRYISAMAFDSGRHVTVLFGGVATGGYFTNETWEWSGAAWTPKGSGGPSSRGLHAMAYDASRGVTVLFGGQTANGTYSDETWEWNGTEWTQRVVSGPGQRAFHAMVYDAARGVSVLFGGWDPASATAFSDTWEWNGAVWIQRANDGPSARYAHAMAYDAARGVTVLFGGREFGDPGPMWEWNGMTWTERVVSGPSPRAFHAMAYDAARAVTVLFGGASTSWGVDSETWEWNGTNWTRRAGGDPNVLGAMAYDEARSQTVLFGRLDDNGSGETWEWGGTSWAQRFVSGPSSRILHAMAYDANREVTVLFGGRTGYDVSTGSNISNGETWEWNGTTWTQRAISGPSARYMHAMAFDTTRGVAVLFGGFHDDGNNGIPYGDTWEWNGAAWTLRTDTGPLPRLACAMAYDSARGVVVLFGGRVYSGGSTYNSDETWEWDGTAWTQRVVSGPSPRYLHAMAYDSSRGTTVLFGGVVYLDSNETWEWDGAAWTQPVVCGPEARAGHAMAYDAARGVTVLYQHGTWELGVTPCVAPSVIVQPPTQTVCAGATARFAATTAGTCPFTYQWRKGGVVIAGATDSTYSFDSASNTDGGTYDCVATNACGSAASNGVTLTITTTPASLTAQPSDLATCEGDVATFSVGAEGCPPPTYQWRKGGVDINGAVDASYYISSATASDAGTYDCVVTNAYGTETSATAALTIVTTPPSITTQPSSVSACQGSFVYFTIDGVGCPMPVFQWRKGGVDISGAVDSTYYISSATASDAGTYDCVVTNAYGTVTSDTATLTVCIADFDDGTGTGNCDGGIGIEDLLFYLGVYDTGVVRADVDDGSATGTPDGGVGIEDLLYFLVRYDTGC